MFPPLLCTGSQRQSETGAIVMVHSITITPERLVENSAMRPTGYHRPTAYHRLAFTAFVYAIAFFCLFVVRLILN